MYTKIIFLLVCCIVFAVLAQSDSLEIADSISIDTLSNGQDVLPCTLSINTVPAGATVVIGDSIRGLSPVTITDISSGKHTVKMLKRGHYSKQVTLLVKPEEHNAFTFELLKPAELRVTSTPDSIRFSLAEKKGLRTPVTVDKLKPGDYVVKATQSNYVPFDTLLTLENGENDSLHIKLQHTDAYIDSVSTAQKVAKETGRKKKRIGLIVSFVAFISVIYFFEFLQ